MATLDFDRLEQAGVSKNKVLDFVKAQDSNFNYQELQDFYKQQGFNEEESTRALYHDLRNFKGFDFNPNFTPQKISTQPQEANTQPAPSAQDKTPTQELSPSEQAKADLDALKASQSPKPISPEELQEQAKQIGWHSVGDDLLSVVYENEAYKNNTTTPLNPH
ncbi:hypothetical protein [Helicobacter ailurogastricus]|uniref:hypothetical protein n=1 Tax=Helicobacter ailurogastricus TaxID=1578720 RepID=UPI000CF0AC39|nr:hypothetical protein [Helicobacter ailurogastricus]